MNIYSVKLSLKTELFTTSLELAIYTSFWEGEKKEMILLMSPSSFFSRHLERS